MAAVYAIKPMNCPGHVQVFKQGITSYRELPYAASLNLARYIATNHPECIARHVESACVSRRMMPISFAHLSRSLRGDRLLFAIRSSGSIQRFRVRRYPQIKFADRPDVRVGEDAVWDQAENALISGTGARPGSTIRIIPGEGAFYGPKLEFVLARCDWTRLAMWYAPGRPQPAVPTRRQLHWRRWTETYAGAPASARCSARLSGLSGFFSNTAMLATCHCGWHPISG